MPREAHKLHLIVGRSLFLNFPERLRRVYVSNPVVLDSIASSPFELVITAKSAGTSSLVLWSTGGQTQMYTVLADVDVAGLRESLADALPGDHVEVEAQQGRVHLSGVVGSDAAADEAARLAGIYSKDVINSLVVDPGHLPQVQLQVRIAEIDRSKLTAFGINLFGLNGNNIGQGSTEQFSPFTFQPSGSATQAITSDFLNLFYFDVKNGIGATIKDLQTKGMLQILAEPNLTTLHGKTARFLAGGEFPYPIVQPGGAGSVPTVTVQFRPLWSEAGIHSFRELRWNHTAEGGAGGKRAGLYQRGGHCRIRAAGAIHPQGRDGSGIEGWAELRHLRHSR